MEQYQEPKQDRHIEGFSGLGESKEVKTPADVLKENMLKDVELRGLQEELQAQNARSVEDRDQERIDAINKRITELHAEGIQ